MLWLLTVAALGALAVALNWRSQVVFHPADARRLGPQEQIRQRLAEQYARGELTAAEYRDAYMRLR